ncbi:putative clathrin assembly protein At4g40080 [Nicotiana sylvestris]|uniref:Clathrin assembly protein At4g40080 n=1 Tax=Nicotiana sylvestris TaxID=4096 RepID=A0A1U7XNU6_NICSY|nr:PREDICTED: putative clathrin assembly protein At4g40080 [Nicotiana sylvestris]
MSRKRKLRDLMGIFKDKASLIKANLSTKRSVSSIQVAVIRATTHASASPPHDHRISAIISAGDNSLPAIYACIEAIMDRLHRTHNPYVALKCLFVFHNILAKGSLLYKDHISFFPSSGGHNSLNLSGFYDKSDIETRELSSWVRWYANVLERNMITSRALGSYISPSSRLSINFDKITDKKGNIGFSYRSDFATEMESLRLEGCRKKLNELFIRRKNDLLWEMVSQKKMEMEKVKYERERQSFLLWNVDEKSVELTRSSQKVAGNNYQLLFAAA